MKVVKVVIIIISIITVAFFATGLFFSEINYSTAVTINKPKDEVFVRFSDIEGSKEWIPSIKTISVRKKTDSMIGSIYDLEVLDGNGQISVIQKVLDYKNGELISLSFNANDMNKVNRFSFADIGNKTELKLEATIRSNSYALSCIFPYFKSVFVQQDQSYLNDFKTYIETNKP